MRFSGMSTLERLSVLGPISARCSMRGSALADDGSYRRAEVDGLWSASRNVHRLPPWSHPLPGPNPSLHSRMILEPSWPSPRRRDDQSASLRHLRDDPRAAEDRRRTPARDGKNADPRGASSISTETAARQSRRASLARPRSSASRPQLLWEGPREAPEHPFGPLLRSPQMPDLRVTSAYARPATSRRRSRARGVAARGQPRADAARRDRDGQTATMAWMMEQLQRPRS